MGPEPVKTCDYDLLYGGSEAVQLPRLFKIGCKVKLAAALSVIIDSS